LNEPKREDYDTHVVEGESGIVRGCFPERVPPTLLDLTVKTFCPDICHGFYTKTKIDHAERIPEGVEVEMRPEGVDRSAVRATAALHPERTFEGFKITDGKTVAPKADAVTGRATGRLIPWV
jgi:hypothetical protein